MLTYTLTTLYRSLHEAHTNEGGDQVVITENYAECRELLIMKVRYAPGVDYLKSMLIPSDTDT